MKYLLATAKTEHNKIDTELQKLLDKYKDEGKQPGFIAENMAKLKTELKLGMEESDNVIADLITDSCDMG